LAEVDALVEAADAPAEVERAAGAARIILPAATRTFANLGFTLARTAVEQHQAAGTTAVIEAFASQAQEAILRALFDLAIDLLRDQFGAVGVLDALTDLDDDDRAPVVEALTALHDRLTDLSAVDFADAEAWLATMLSCVSAAEVVLSRGVVPGPGLPGVRQGLALMWAGGTLANRVVAWFRNPARGITALFGSSPAPVPDNSSTAAFVAQSLNKPAGTGLTFADLMTFLVGQDPIEELTERLPAARDVITWIRAAFASPAGDILQRLLIDLAAPEDLDVEELFESLGEACATAIAEEIVPNLLDPMKQQDPDNEAIALVIDELVIPTLVGLPLVVLPRVPELGDADVAVRLREALSAVLLQSLSRFVMAAVDVLLEHAMTEGEGAIRQVGAIVEEAEEQAPGFATVAMAASGATLGISVTPQDVVGILDLVADAVQLCNDELRRPLLEAVGAMLSLGLSTEGTRAATLATLTGSDDAPAAEDLRELLDEVAGGVWSMVQLVGPRVLELMALHYLNQAVAIAEDIYKGAKAVVAAVEQGIAWLAQQASELVRLVGELAGQVAALMAKALGDIRALSTHLATLVAGVLESIRAYGASLADPLLEPFPQFVQDALMGLYDALFDLAETLITAPFHILSAVAGWAESALQAALQQGTVGEQQIRSSVADRIHAAFAGALTFELKVSLGSIPIPFDGEIPIEFNAGTVTIPGGEIVRMVAGAVLGDGVFTETIRTAAADAQKAQGTDAQRRNAQATLDGVLNQQQASQVAQDLVVDAPLSVTIVAPADRTIHERSADLRIRISGANGTFVRPTLGVPPRVEIRMNGRPCSYAPEQWSQVGNGIEISLRIAPMPEPRRRPDRRIPVAIRSGVEQVTAVTATLTEDRGEVVLDRPGTYRAARVDASLFETRRGSLRNVATMAEEGGGVLAEGGAPVTLIGEVTAEMVTQPLPDPAPLAPLPLTPGPDGVVRVSRWGINSVQVSVSDGKSERAAQSVVFFLSSGVPASSPVTIEGIEYDPPGWDVAGEYVVLRSWATADVDMTGWTLRDLAGHVYRFPAFVLGPSSQVRLYTRAGENGPGELFWGRRAAVWNNRGDAALLVDAEGREVHRYTYAPRPIR
jgi:hypothetical protein